MKIHSLFTEISFFLIVLLFLIAPPLFSNIGNQEQVVVMSWGFPLPQMGLALCSLFIFLVYHKLRKSKTNILGFRIFLTIGLLFTTSFFLNFLALVIPSVNISQSVQFSIPDTFITWLFCILNFLFSAFSEEVIYRFYFTDTLISILTQINAIFERKVFRVICELVGCFVFAFAHSYLGFFAVINAAIAHFILRYTYKKSSSIIPGVIAHFAYNMISLILL